MSDRYPYIKAVADLSRQLAKLSEVVKMQNDLIAKMNDSKDNWYYYCVDHSAIQVRLDQIIGHLTGGANDQ